MGLTVGGGGFFGSGKKDARSSTLSQQSGFSEIGGSATSLNLNQSGKNASTVITMLDGGAVLGSLDLAGEALKQLGALAGKASDSMNSQVSQAYALANQARQSETSGAINNFLKYGAIIAGIALVAWAVVKSK